MDFTIEARWPDGPFSGGDVRASFRSVVGARLRRAMEKIANHAAADYDAYPRISDAFRVTQTSGDELEYTIDNTSEIFPFVEADTRPHVITAHGNFLAFPGPWAGGVVFVKSVNHPGTKGHYRLQNAWDEGANDLSDAVEEGVMAWLESWGNASA